MSTPDRRLIKREKLPQFLYRFDRDELRTYDTSKLNEDLVWEFTKWKRGTFTPHPQVGSLYSCRTSIGAGYSGFATMAEAYHEQIFALNGQLHTINVQLSRLYKDLKTLTTNGEGLYE